jgi:hypothetical protein
MYKRLQKYRSAVSMSLNDTYKVDLPAQGSLSFIQYIVSATEAAGAPFQSSAVGKWRAVDELDNVIVRVNGRSDVVNVPGRVMNYLTWLDQGVTAYDRLREYSAASQVARGLINFGRWAWDPMLALDLSQFDNVEFNLTNIMSSTYWASSPTVSLILGFLDGAGRPTGTKFFRKELWRSYTTSQDGREYLEIPTALPIRRIGLQADSAVDATYGTADTAIGNLLYDIKLSFMSGQVIPFDGRMWDLYHLRVLEDGGLPMTFGANYHQADYGWRSGIGDVRAFAAISGARDGSGSSTVPTREGDLSSDIQKWEAYEADSPIDWIAYGAAYENCTHFDFGHGYPEYPLLDPSRAGQGIVELELHTRNSSSAADGTVRVFLDRLAGATDVG